MHEIEKKLFGTVRPKEASGGFAPDPQALRAELPDRDYSLFYHCSGCGTVKAVLGSAVPEITGKQWVSYAEHYIATERCDSCLGEGFENARLERIPEEQPSS